MNDPFREVKVESSQGERNGNGTSRGVKSRAEVNAKKPSTRNDNKNPAFVKYLVIGLDTA